MPNNNNNNNIDNVYGSVIMAQQHKSSPGSLDEYRIVPKTYLATASLYTNPARARLTISRHRSEPSMLQYKYKISYIPSCFTLEMGQRVYAELRPKQSAEAFRLIIKY